ncbi:hypothetical protein OIO90_006488 [Microbotryomycetes sp. JL221]|nr:hypothetical protein OIO90_006488 [Microbotryomycetes sp. JL221]
MTTLKPFSDALDVLETFSDELKQSTATDGTVSLQLSADEARALASSINVVSRMSVSNAVSPRELVKTVSVMKDMANLCRSTIELATDKRSRLSQRSSIRSLTRSTPPSPVSKSDFITLPADIIKLILDELARLYEGERCTSKWTFGSQDSNRNSYWQNVEKLSRLPKLAKRLSLSKLSAHHVRKLTVTLQDFELSVLRSQHDEGFALPDVLKSVPNLTHLAISTGRSPTWRSRRSTSETMDEFVGGESLPHVITTSLTRLQHLVYEPPCTIADLSMFVQSLSQLETLVLNGHCDASSLVLEEASCPLSMLWAPKMILNAQQIKALSTPTLRSLAVGVDPELSETPDAALADLSSAFKTVGPQLRELCITSPVTDDLRFPGGAGGLGNVLTMTMTILGGGPLGGGPLGGGLGAAGAANQGANPPAGANGPAPANAALAAAGPGQPNIPAGTVAPPPHPTGPVAPGRPGGGRLNPNRLPPGVFILPPPRNNGINGPQQPTMFFNDLVAYCPNLWRLEVYGKDYTHDMLSQLPLTMEHLTLSVPGQPQTQADNNGAFPVAPVADEEDPSHSETKLVAQTLEQMISLGSKPRLRRLELSGRAGDWAAKERKLVKEACQKHGGYAAHARLGEQPGEHENWAEV